MAYLQRSWPSPLLPCPLPTTRFPPTPAGKPFSDWVTRLADGQEAAVPPTAEDTAVWAPAVGGLCMTLGWQHLCFTADPSNPPLAVTVPSPRPLALCALPAQAEAHVHDAYDFSDDEGVPPFREELSAAAKHGQPAKGDGVVKVSAAQARPGGGKQPAAKRARA